MDNQEKLNKIYSDIRVQLINDSNWDNMPQFIIDRYVECIEDITGKKFVTLTNKECEDFAYINLVTDVRNARAWNGEDDIYGIF